MKQIQLTVNSTILTYYVPSTGATILITNTSFPSGMRTNVQYIAAYDSESIVDTIPQTTSSRSTSKSTKTISSAILPIQKVKPKKRVPKRIVHTSQTTFSPPNILIQPSTNSSTSTEEYIDDYNNVHQTILPQSTAL